MGTYALVEFQFVMQQVYFFKHAGTYLQVPKVIAINLGKKHPPIKKMQKDKMTLSHGAWGL